MYKVLSDSGVTVSEPLYIEEEREASKVKVSSLCVPDALEPNIELDLVTRKAPEAVSEDNI